MSDIEDTDTATIEGPVIALITAVLNYVSKKLLRKANDIEEENEDD